MSVYSLHVFRHASGVVLWTAVSVGGTTSLVQTEISQQLVEGKFTDIYGPQRMNFGDLLTFPPVL